MDDPSNVKNDKYPISSDWSNQENFWYGKAYEWSTGPRCRYWSIPTKQDDNDTDWSDNHYPQNYRAKTQSQVTPRQPPPGWPKGVRLQSHPLLQIQKIILTLTLLNPVKNLQCHKEERDPTVGPKCKTINS